LPYPAFPGSAPVLAVPGVCPRGPCPALPCPALLATPDLCAGGVPALFAESLGIFPGSGYPGSGRGTPLYALEAQPYDIEAHIGHLRANLL